MRAWLLAAMMLALPLAGCLGPSQGGLVVVAQAPRLANGMSIAIALPRGMLGAPEGTASFSVHYNGQVVYPPGGAVGAPMDVKEGKGSAFVPYAWFVIDNGDYEVTVDFDGRHATTRVPVEKWVHWVYALPYIKQGVLVVDIVLERTPGEPNDRVFAAGQLNLDVRYRGSSGRDNEMAFSKTVQSDGADDFIRVEMPLGDFDARRGYYSAEATFANFQAVGNSQVPMDPTLNDYNPPTNWVFVEGS
jgi:hypothetical protein